MALADLDQGRGAFQSKSCRRCFTSTRPFVTTAVEIARKEGFLLRRRTSEDDARGRADVADRQDLQAYREPWASQQQALNDFIFAEFGDREPHRVHPQKLTSLKKSSLRRPA